MDRVTFVVLVKKKSWKMTVLDHSNYACVTHNASAVVSKIIRLIVAYILLMTCPLNKHKPNEALV